MEELINPHFRTGKASGRPSWPRAQQEGGSSLEMVVVELSVQVRAGPDSNRYSPIMRPQPVRAPISSPHTAKVKQEQVSSSILHYPTLLSRQETHGSCSSGSAAGASLRHKTCWHHTQAPSAQLLHPRAPRSEGYNLVATGTQTHSAPLLGSSASVSPCPFSTSDFCAAFC